MAATSIDTRALVKRSVAEVGSAWVRRMVARPVQHVMYTAALTKVAVRSALSAVRSSSAERRAARSQVDHTTEQRRTG
jgi:hypothetical protein